MGASDKKSGGHVNSHVKSCVAWMAHLATKLKITLVFNGISSYRDSDSEDDRSASCIYMICEVGLVCIYNLGLGVNFIKVQMALQSRVFYFVLVLVRTPGYRVQNAVSTVYSSVKGYKRTSKDGKVLCLKIQIAQTDKARKSDRVCSFGEGKSSEFSIGQCQHLCLSFLLLATWFLRFPTHSPIQRTINQDQSRQN